MYSIRVRNKNGRWEPFVPRLGNESEERAMNWYKKNGEFFEARGRVLGLFKSKTFVRMLTEEKVAI